MGFKMEPKALEIFEKPEALLTGGFNVNHITHSKWFSQTGNEKSLNLHKDQFYLSPESERDGGFFYQQSIKGLQSWSSRYDSVKVRHCWLPKFCCYFIQKQSKLV